MREKRIVITDEILDNAAKAGITVSKQLGVVYEKEIADMVSANPKLAGKDPINFAMMQAKVDGNTRIEDVYRKSAAGAPDGIMRTELENKWLFPALMDRRIREGPAKFNLSPYLVANTQSESAMGVKILKYDDYDPENKDMLSLKRVAEGTDLPLAWIRFGEGFLKMTKRGRACRITYEAIKYATINQMMFTLDRIARNIAADQALDALSSLILGDGNNNPAQVHTGTSLTQDVLFDFSMEYAQEARVPLTTLVTANPDFNKTLMQWTFPTDTGMGMAPGVRFNFPQSPLSDITVLYIPEIVEAIPKTEDFNPATDILGLSRDYTTTKHFAAGSEIREYDIDIWNQTHLGTISEIAGFSKIDDKTARILRLSPQP